LRGVGILIKDIFRRGSVLTQNPPWFFPVYASARRVARWGIGGFIPLFTQKFFN